MKEESPNTTIMKMSMLLGMAYATLISVETDDGIPFDLQIKIRAALVKLESGIDDIYYSDPNKKVLASANPK